MKVFEQEAYEQKTLAVEARADRISNTSMSTQVLELEDARSLRPRGTADPVKFTRLNRPVPLTRPTGVVLWR